ncbi:hypothetical protein OSG_eHP34_00140 [environmental Halophage eHP-34]|nr:hypothetical protein OSG_eHP34_00140 [environmental Halophage eHP-34]
MTRAVDIEGRGVRVNGRSVEVGSAIPDATITRPTDTNTSGDVTSYEGEILTPDKSLVKVEAEVSANTTGIDKLAIYASDGTLLAEDTTVSTGGDVAVLDGLSLSSGTDYYIMGYNGGNVWNFGFEANNHPYTSSAGDLTTAVTTIAIDGTWDTSVGAVRVINNVDLYS